MEHKRDWQRDWHRRMLDGKLRDQAREYPPDGFDQSGGYLSPPVIPDISQIMQFTTEALRSRFEGVGLQDPWMLERSNIFEGGVLKLGIILAKTPLPNFLRNAASKETLLLANSLAALFTGGVRLHATELNDVSAVFSGYFEHFDRQTKRVSVMQWLKKAPHPQSGRMMQPNCQILVREIIGRSSRGKAVAGSDLRIRCGLRFGGWISDNKWRVSIDSGIPTSEKHKRPLLHRIGSITQAYNVSRGYPESFYYLQDTDTIDTFHFEDANTKTTDPENRDHWFSTFNRYLNLVFRELART